MKGTRTKESGPSEARSVEVFAYPAISPWPRDLPRSSRRRCHRRQSRSVRGVVGRRSTDTPCFLPGGRPAGSSAICPCEPRILLSASSGRQRLAGTESDPRRSRAVRSGDPTRCRRMFEERQPRRRTPQKGPDRHRSTSRGTHRGHRAPANRHSRGCTNPDQLATDNTLSNSTVSTGRSRSAARPAP